jgi:tRNA threonylcarbamoyladenosine biosynthesis protein TsaB
MRILAIDTAFRQCSVALGVNNEQVAFLQSQEVSKQSEELFSLINKMFEDQKITFADLTAIAVNIGPGSFTGVRIGVAAAKGLKLVLSDIKLISVTSLELLASQVKNNLNKIAVLEAGQEEYYVQVFNQNSESISEPKNCDISELMQIFLSNVEAVVISNCQLPYDGEYKTVNINAETVLKIAYNKVLSVNEQDNIKPFYIKGPRIHAK